MEFYKQIIECYYFKLEDNTEARFAIQKYTGKIMITSSFGIWQYKSKFNNDMIKVHLIGLDYFFCSNLFEPFAGNANRAKFKIMYSLFWQLFINELKKETKAYIN